VLFVEKQQEEDLQIKHLQALWLQVKLQLTQDTVTLMNDKNWWPVKIKPLNST